MVRIQPSFENERETKSECTAQCGYNTFILRIACWNKSFISAQQCAACYESGWWIWFWEEHWLWSLNLESRVGGGMTPWLDMQHGYTLHWAFWQRRSPSASRRTRSILFTRVCVASVRWERVQGVSMTSVVADTFFVWAVWLFVWRNAKKTPQEGISGGLSNKHKREETNGRYVWGCGVDNCLVETCCLPFLSVGCLVTRMEECRKDTRKECQVVWATSAKVEETNGWRFGDAGWTILKLVACEFCVVCTHSTIVE